MKTYLIVAILAVLLAGCTSVKVRPVQSGLGITDVCIQVNPRVTLEDFLPVVRDGFARHRIATRVVAQPAPEECEAVLSYTAQTNWDFVAYLIHANLTLKRGSQILGTAEYHLAATGGLSPFKWQSTKTKMDPVIDKLLAQVHK
mgnify:CR=1 FL=1